MEWIQEKKPGAKSLVIEVNTAMNNWKRKLVQTALVLVFLVATAFAGWEWRKGKESCWKTPEAYFLRFDNGSLECVFQPGFIESLFGPNWRDSDLYIAFKGTTTNDIKSCVNGPYVPMRSLSLGLPMRGNRPPSGNRWDIDVALYSRKSRYGCVLSIRMKAHQVHVLRKGPSILPEKLLPNGLLTF